MSCLDFEDAIEDAVGYFELREFREGKLAAVAEEQGDDVGVGVEAGAFLRHVVGDDHVGALAREFAASVFGEAVCFGGKAYQTRGHFVAQGRG